MWITTAFIILGQYIIKSEARISVAYISDLFLAIVTFVKHSLEAKVYGVVFANMKELHLYA